MKIAPLEERIYRHRCVERWSIVVPWIGYSVERAAQAGRADVEGEVRRVPDLLRSEADAASGTGPGFKIPYVEGLRLDEAMHPLALLCVGMYGEALPNQNGAPVRMVCRGSMATRASSPSSRSSLVEKQPPTTWNLAERPRVRLLLERESGGGPSPLEPGDGTPAGRIRMRKTLKFNGYGDQVASLYTGHGPAKEVLHLTDATETSPAEPMDEGPALRVVPGSAADLPGLARLITRRHTGAR